MEVKTWPLQSKDQTVNEIRYAVNKYHADLRAFPSLIKMSVQEFFNFVKEIPYVRDVPETEMVSRPKYLLTMFPALDCKKKAILMGSFMRLKYGPGSYRFVLSSNRKDGKMGHVFTQIFNSSRWINADATYNNNALGATKIITNFEIVGG
jgi:hypothetical protein